MTQGLPNSAILALGVTQNIGYGTLYYSFSILAADMAQSLSWSTEWIFGALSIALLIGGLTAPWLGVLVQYGAAFALVVQLRPAVAQQSITYLTLIAGFASTMFWPITSALHAQLS